MQKYWINVIPKTEALRRVEESITQSEGLEAHLDRMQKDDMIIFYSPRALPDATEKLQTFTGLGQIADDIIYRVELSPELKSFRRKVNFRKVKETPLRPLIQHLSFIRNKKHWGFIFKLNLIQIPKEDFDIISEAMLI
jgi:hypothetical protein